MNDLHIWLLTLWWIPTLPMDQVLSLKMYLGYIYDGLTHIIICVIIRVSSLQNHFQHFQRKDMLILRKVCGILICYTC